MWLTSIKKSSNLCAEMRNKNANIRRAALAKVRKGFPPPLRVFRDKKRYVRTKNFTTHNDA